MLKFEAFKTTNTTTHELLTDLVSAGIVEPLCLHGHHVGGVDVGAVLAVEGLQLGPVALQVHVHQREGGLARLRAVLQT